MSIQLETSDSFQYVFYPLPSLFQGTLKFKVKAPANCSVILSGEANPGDCADVLEVLIGVTENQTTNYAAANRSAIRRNRTLPDKAAVDTPEILSAIDFRGFWINYQGGVITVGKENETYPFLVWTDPSPIYVGYIGVCTSFGATGEWVIDGETINTLGGPEHIYRPVSQLFLDIDVQASKCAYIVLTSGPELTSPMYGIVLGGWDNTASAIRYDQEKKEKVRVKTPHLLSTSVPQHFRISWENGLVSITRRGDGHALMDWQDPKPFNVTYFGVRTAYGATGTWNIIIVNDKKTQDEPTLAWVRGKQDVLPPNSVVGGFQKRLVDANCYVGRVHLKGALVPGKIFTSEGTIWATIDTDELTNSSDYEYLTGTNFKWVPSQNGEVLPNAVIGGYTKDGEPLYIGRGRLAEFDNEMICGKIQPDKGVCIVGRHYHAHTLKENYEILIQDTTSKVS